MNDRPVCRLCLRPLIVDGGICGECLDEMDRQWGAWAMVVHRREPGALWCALVELLRRADAEGVKRIGWDELDALRRGDDPPPLVSLGQGDYSHEPDGTFAVALCVFGIVVAVGLAVWVLARWWT